MPLDFSRLHTTDSSDSVIAPREIFRALPNRDRRYQFPRDVQAEVWNSWYENRNNRDQVLKMNTGSGKTAVGLILLKSCLNEGVGPAVYIAPSPYLAQQAKTEAERLGLAVDSNLESLSVRQGRSILITTIKYLFNGLSRFGVGEDNPKIEIGSLVIDDAHACLQEVEDQFTLTIDSSSPAYAKLFLLFRDSLAQQSERRVMELEQQEPHARAIVPFWAWQECGRQVLSILHEVREHDEVKFAWPLLKDVIAQCRCVFGGGKVEISPIMLPVDVIPSFVRTKRRLFMSATFADDSVLVSHFDVSPDAFARILVPSSANDIGDRMILVPQAISPSITDENLKHYLAQKAEKYNVVVIVPSGYRAEFWRDVAASVLTANNLADGVQAMRDGHVGLSVLVNRYDGIDLPDDACRILVIDGVPDVRRLADKVEQSVRHGSDLLRSEAIHRIEQGMGRANRSADDYSVVLLMGRSLVAQLFRTGAKSKFTAATKAQIQLSEQVAQQLGGGSLDDLGEAVDHCLTRNADWVRASRGSLVGLQYPKGGQADSITVARREAFNAARIGDHQRAVKAIQNVIDATDHDNSTKGWLLAELAAYQNRIDTVHAQVTLRSAKRVNHQVITPMDGISYHRLQGNVSDQAARCLEYLRNQYPEGNTLLIAINAILDDLRFEPETAPEFERAVALLGGFLGFETQRPEAEYGRGPDVLWKMGDLKFGLIEAKNGAVADRISKSDCDQLAGSINWFGEEYDKSCVCVPLLVHPSSRSGYDATPPPDSKAITLEKLDELKVSIRNFSVATSSKPRYGNHDEVARLLAHYGLTASTIFDRYSTAIK